MGAFTSFECLSKLPFSSKDIYDINIYIAEIKEQKEYGNYKIDRDHK